VTAERTGEMGDRGYFEGGDREGKLLGDKKKGAKLSPYDTKNGKGKASFSSALNIKGGEGGGGGMKERFWCSRPLKIMPAQCEVPKEKARKAEEGGAVLERKHKEVNGHRSSSWGRNRKGLESREEPLD